MVPCPWAREAAARYRGEDVGVHLTVNAEWELYRWGPITHAPSLLDGDGGFPRTVEDVWDHADLDEVRRECRAQIERAILWGFDVSHLDAHMGTLQLRPEFFDVYLDLAVEFRLPLRMSGAATESSSASPPASSPPRPAWSSPTTSSPSPASDAGSSRAAICGLKPGVTELYLHPAVDSPELRAMAPDWEERVDDLTLRTGCCAAVGRPASLSARALEGPGRQLIGHWSGDLRAARRGRRPRPAPASAGRSGTRRRGRPRSTSGRADPAAGQEVVVVGVERPQHLGRKAEPERRGRVDLGGVGAQRVAPARRRSR